MIEESLNIKIFTYQHYAPQEGYAFIDYDGSIVVYIQNNWKKLASENTVREIIQQYTSYTQTITDNYYNMPLDLIIEILMTLTMKQWGVGDKKELIELFKKVKEAEKFADDLIELGEEEKQC